MCDDDDRPNDSFRAHVNTQINILEETMTDLQEIFDYVDRHQQEFLEDLEDLCACRSASGDIEGLEAARKTAVRQMEQAGLNVVRVPVENGNAMIYGELDGKKDYTVLFYNHYDVVEEGKKEKWITSDPFRLEQIGDKLYARGVSDDKGPLLSRIHAVQSILNTRGSLPVHVKFLVEGDEESASPSMVRYQKEREGEFKELTRADICFWENGRRDKEGRPWARFGVRGACGFNLKVTTASLDVHGRMGATVPSASWRLVWALSTLKDRNERVAIEGFYDDVIRPSEADFEAIRNFPYEEEKVKKELGLKEFLCGATGEKLKERIYLEPSLSICGIEAGELFNGPRGIVPHTAWARISFYLVADQDPDKIHDQLRKHLDKNGFQDVEIEYMGGSRAVKTSVDIPERKVLEETAELVYGKSMVLEPSQLGAGPAIVIRNAWSEIPIIGIGPGNNSGNHHAPNENLILDDYIKSVKQIIAFLYGAAELAD